MSSTIDSRESNTSTASERAGIYRLPGVGGRLSDVRDFYDELKPTPADSVGVKAGKNAIRYGTVAAAGAAATATAAIVCL